MDKSLKWRDAFQIIKKKIKNTKKREDMYQIVRDIIDCRRIGDQELFPSKIYEVMTDNNMIKHVVSIFDEKYNDDIIDEFLELRDILGYKPIPEKVIGFGSRVNPVTDVVVKVLFEKMAVAQFTINGKRYQIYGPMLEIFW